MGPLHLVLPERLAGTLERRVMMAERLGLDRNPLSSGYKASPRDVTLFLETDARADLFTPPQQVSLVLNGKTFKTFPGDTATAVLQRIAIPAADLGTEDMVELRLDVDKTFVPAKLPNSNNTDTRELGIRVYHLFVDPK